MHINDLLKIASERKASDLHLKVGLASRAAHQRRADPARRDEAPHAGGHHRHGVLDHEQPPEAEVQGQPRDRHRVLGARPRPLPLQRLPAARHGRPGAARHPGQDPDRPRAGPAGRAREDRAGAARPDPVHRHHRLGQVDDARGDDRLHQRAAHASTSSRSRTRSSSCTATRSRSSTSARSRSTRAVVRRGAAHRAAPGPRRDPGRRDARLRDDRDRDHRGRDRPPGALDAAHARRDRDHQPHHLRLPAAPAEADPPAARGRAEGRHLACASCRAPTATAACPRSR